jgi:putative hemolysin
MPHYLTRIIHLLSLTLAFTAIFLGYGTMTVWGQALGSDQPCSASTPCHKICGDHPCAPGEVYTMPNAIKNQNNPATQVSSVPQQTNQTTPQNVTSSSNPSVPQPFKFSTKGQISNSSGIAPGTVVWTILNGNNATFIYHATNGVVVIRLTTTPDPICANVQNQICLDGKITQLKDPDQVFSVGEQSKINIHSIQKQETVGFLTGPLQNIVLQIDLTKIWTYNTGTTLANPASTYCVNHGGALKMKTGPAGQYGICTFSNGSQCDEWQYFKGECSPTQTSLTSTNSTSMQSAMSSNSTNSTSMHGTSINPHSANLTVNVTNSTYR